MDKTTIWAIILLVLIIFLVRKLMPYISIWLSAKLSEVNIDFLQLLFMRLRNVPPKIIVDSMITAHKAGIPVNRDELEAHYLAGGNVTDVVRALIYAKRANIPLEFKEATTIDLKDGDILTYVEKLILSKKQI
ncbi:MAG: flotillin-like FloA family protein [Chitinophagales bacterium]|nr:flotillin-like FloA family protein [Chitinophagales bacterium]